MIVRIVKLTFRAEEIKTFKSIFEASKNAIRSMEGNHHLECLQCVDDDRVFFTYSHWENEATLENYRHSALFKATWSKTKALFAEKPEAWSSQLIDRLP